MCLLLRVSVTATTTRNVVIINVNVDNKFTAPFGARGTTHNIYSNKSSSIATTTILGR